MSPESLNAVKKIICIVLLILICPICFPAMAGNTPNEIIMASEEWTNATNRDGTGLYWDIFRAVYEPLGIKTKFIIQSFNGSVSLVKKNRVDAAVGIYPEMIEGALFSRYPFVKDYVLALFKKNRFEQWNGQATLKDKKVAWIKGYSYDKYLEVPVVKTEFNRRDDILHRLAQNEVDFFMDTRNDMESVLNQGIIEVSRCTVEPVLELDRYLVFASNIKGKKLKNIFDHRFPRLVRSGEIENLFTKWNW
ncbi:MAG: transporter substrate-binding domain-containing protein [Desulfobacterales bacterium]|nr:MAG: transporter substrate-binding domain-containing protein [Desulfobacterales bacterium]